MKISVLVLVAALAFIAGRELMARNVEYVLPDNFQGFVNVVETTGAAALEPSLKGLVVDVPPSGRVEVRSIDVLRKWNVVRARYLSGKSLPVFVQGVQNENQFGFWIMGVPAGERLYAFVGNREELEAFIDSNEKKIYRSPPVDPTQE